MNEAASAVLMRLEAEGNLRRLTIQLARLDVARGTHESWHYSSMDKLAMAVLAHVSNEEHPQHFVAMKTDNAEGKMLQSYVQCVQQLYRVIAYEMPYVPAECISAQVYGFLSDLGEEGYMQAQWG